MENASKALLIAAAVLITILLIVFGIRVFNSPKDVVDETEKIGESIASTIEKATASIQTDLLGSSSGTGAGTGSTSDSSSDAGAGTGSTSDSSSDAGAGTGSTSDSSSDAGAGTGSTSDSSSNTGEASNSEIIKFTVQVKGKEEIEYEAKEGMTWESWINEKKPDGFRIDTNGNVYWFDDGYFTSGTAYYIIKNESEEDTIKSTDTINNWNYYSKDGIDIGTPS